MKMYSFNSSVNCLKTFLRGRGGGEELQYNYLHFHDTIFSHKLKEQKSIKNKYNNANFFRRLKVALTWSNSTTSEKMSPIGRSCFTTSVLILKGILATTCKQKSQIDSRFRTQIHKQYSQHNLLNSRVEKQNGFKPNFINFFLEYEGIIWIIYNHRQQNPKWISQREDK